MFAYASAEFGFYTLNTDALKVWTLSQFLFSVYFYTN